jgi:hypothetical protein
MAFKVSTFFEGLIASLSLTTYISVNSIFNCVGK